MKSYKSCIVLIICIFAFSQLYISTIIAQEAQPKLLLNGYVSDMQSATFDSIKGNWLTDNLIHNRLNFKWLPSERLSFVAELRNRFAYGDNITRNPKAYKNYDSDNGLVDLSLNITHGKSFVLNTMTDRLFASYENGKFKATLGRQRINWGQTFVWNPNDIFNAYSFFDFDYVERPGSDALRLQYYNTEISSTELAFKLDRNKKLTTAGMYKFNVWETDFQVLGGILNGVDYVAGAGFSGAIKSVSVRGEASYFKPIKNFSDSSGVLLASIGVDYTFPNAFSLLAEYLYSGNAGKGNFNFTQYYAAPLTVKDLSFVKHNFVLQASYPITPLLSGSLAGMYMPAIKGYYCGPSLSYSLAQNLDFSFYSQLFGGEVNKQKLRFNLFFLRLKLSF